MMAFDVSVDGTAGQLTIFATGERHAFNLYCDHHEATHGAMPSSFSMKRRSISRELNKRWLREALQQGRAGLGILCDSGWIIKPISAR
ncbi:MAG: hypothetical protein K0S66_3223 [Sphingomonas sp.]|jgi:hypothetical protein|nr:hypothetical protein [Sphingomonas sp.]